MLLGNRIVVGWGYIPVVEDTSSARFVQLRCQGFWFYCICFYFFFFLMVAGLNTGIDSLVEVFVFGCGMLSGEGQNAVNNSASVTLFGVRQVIFQFYLHCSVIKVYFKLQFM